MSLHDHITANDDTLGGAVRFKGTRVYVQSLFEHLARGLTVEVFLDEFPTVSRSQVLALLHLAGEFFATGKILNSDETAAG